MAFSARINNGAVQDGAPPHETVFEGYPYVLTGAVQEVAQSVEILFDALTRPAHFSQYSLDLGEIGTHQEFFRNGLPSEMYLLIGFGRAPPLAVSAIFDVPHRGRDFVRHTRIRSSSSSYHRD